MPESFWDAKISRLLLVLLASPNLGDTIALQSLSRVLFQSREDNLPSQRCMRQLGTGLVMVRIAAKIGSRVVSAIIDGHGARLCTVLLLFALIPLASTIQVTQVKGLESFPFSCQPSVQNQFPQSASAGQKIVIVTTVTSACVSDYDQVIVNILPPNSSELLSTAPASPAATNIVTAPATAGPWSLIVQVMWINYPLAGTFEIYQTTITVKVVGSLTVSTAPSPPPHPHSQGHKHPRPFV
jgi:hypothetical protein